MRIRRIAVLIDGGFFIKRLSRLVAPQYCGSAASVANTARVLCKRHVQRLTGEPYSAEHSRWLDHVYRLFYYDARPFVDTDYNEESFFVRHAYFLGANDPYSALKTTLKAEINQEAWATLNSDTSRPFNKPKSGRIAVKVINHLGDEVMKVFRIA
jgi:hypothetical protein